ncbi:MAG: ABC transporter permease [Verrucomicrobia bacterium]|nr:ABC transporter permease [Verrucomicrobiota bacterium]
MQSDARRRLRALIVKEIFQIIRDPSSILISVVLPLIMLIIYGFGVSLDLDHLRIGLVLEDTSPDAISFAKSLTDSRYFEVSIVRDRREMERAIMSGTVRGFIVVPSYFSQFRLRPDQVAPIQVIADGSEPNTANFVQIYAQSAWQNWLQQEQISSDLQGLSLVQLQPRYWFNEELESRNSLVPGSIAVILTLVGTLLTSLVVAREWERGTMEALIATPVTVRELFLGKFISYFVLGMLSFVFSYFFAVWVYDVPARGSFLAFLITAAVFLLPALGLGLYVSTTSRSQIISTQFALILGFMPSFMLSGFVFEISSMPFWIQCFTYVIPARYFVTSLQTLFLVGDVMRLLLINLVPMLILGVLLCVATIKKTVKRLD